MGFQLAFSHINPEVLGDGHATYEATRRGELSNLFQLAESAGPATQPALLPPEVRFRRGRHQRSAMRPRPRDNWMTPASPGIYSRQA